MRLVVARFAAFLSLVAVAAGLLGPVAQLALDVQTGRLGGVCNASEAFAALAQTSSDAAAEHPHCELCSSLALALPPIVGQSVPSTASTLLAETAPLAERARSFPGLPHSRGPPSFLI